MGIFVKKALVIIGFPRGRQGRVLSGIAGCWGISKNPISHCRGSRLRLENNDVGWWRHPLAAFFKPCRPLGRRGLKLLAVLPPCLVSDDAGRGAALDEGRAVGAVQPVVAVP